MEKPLKFKIYYSGVIRRSWKWRAVSSNGRIIASGRGFNSKALALESVNLLTSYTSTGNYEIVYK